ncbi:MAG: uroporphyrinogen-III synthase [Bacteroidales bacterium]|nr:uroporphyrinogen-III synthase [Bacteroidales bacterium]
MRVKNILVSQPKPADITKTPYENIIKKYNVNIEFEKFIKLEGVDSLELRQDHVKLPEYTAVILTSRNTVDHFFRIAKEMRYAVPDELKYFCLNESTALYLQHYIQFRKRKIFFGNQTFAELVEVMKKHKEEKFFLPTSNITTTEDYGEMMREAELTFKKAMIFRTVPADLKNIIDIKKYDMLVFFSPAGIESLKTNFPDFEQGEVAIGGLGQSTCKAITDAGFNLSFAAPTETTPSITMAIEEYLGAGTKKSKKK